MAYNVHWSRRVRYCGSCKESLPPFHRGNTCAICDETQQQSDETQDVIDYMQQNMTKRLVTGFSRLNNHSDDLDE